MLVPEFLSEAMEPSDFSRLAMQQLLPVCYGGTFAFTRASARAHPQYMWDSFAAALSSADDLELGHYMERSWVATFPVQRGVGGFVLHRPPLGSLGGAAHPCPAGKGVARVDAAR